MEGTPYEILIIIFIFISIFLFYDDDNVVWKSGLFIIFNFFW